jgi:hypothetical protein
MAKVKKPSFNEFVAELKKTPRKEFDPDTYLQEKVSWKVNYLDYEGIHGWSQLTDIKVLYGQVVYRMKNFESMSWQEILNTGSHPIQVSEISREAQKRLEYLNIHEDVLFSFRITQTKRMWGIREGSMFKILWWDPYHQVWPIPKPNT